MMRTYHNILTSTSTLFYSNLEELYLVDNGVKKLTSTSKMFPQLQILDIRSNKIQNHEELVGE